MIAEGVFGPEHPDVGKSLNNLAFLYESQGRYAEAEPLYQRAVEIFDKALGENHPNFLTALKNYAIFCEEAGKLDRANELRERIRRIESSG